MQSVLEINLSKITENARLIKEACSRRNVEVLAVTKGFVANPRIVEAIIRGGIEGLADSRLENITALRSAGFHQPITLLRIPCLSDARQVVNTVEYSLNSEPVVIRALSDAAIEAGRVHNIILMIDVGDRREGVLPDDAITIIRDILTLKGVHIAGIGTNMGCFGGILPTLDNLNLLLAIKENIEKSCGIPLDIISGGGTTSLRLICDGTMPAGINQLRIGEGILLGGDATGSWSIDGLSKDAFTLRSEIVELKEKSSLPVGEVFLDAFGNRPEFEDRGMRKRAIISIGRQDVNIDGIRPVDERIHILGASSDHMILDVTDSDSDLKVGDVIPFRLNYQGLLFLNNSSYVYKEYI